MFERTRRLSNAICNTQEIVLCKYIWMTLIFRVTGSHTHNSTCTIMGPTYWCHDLDLTSSHDEHTANTHRHTPQVILLADRSNGRAYATVLHPSVVVVCLSVTLCIVAKRCVVEQKLLLRAYRNCTV